MARQMRIGFVEKIGQLACQCLSRTKVSTRDGVVDLSEQASKLHERPAPSIWNNVRGRHVDTIWKDTLRMSPFAVGLRS